MLRVQVFRLFIAAPLLLTSLAVTGCERKEKIVDIETPGAEVEATKDKDTGEVEVQVNRNE